MRVVGYTYDADTHCEECTNEYISVRLRFIVPDEVALGEVVRKVLTGELNFEDSEGNAIHPIFSDSEAGDTPTYCADCGAFIDDS